MLKTVYADGANASDEPVVSISGNSYCLTDGTIDESEDYSYRLLAVDKTGNKSQPTAELGPAHALLAPAAPTALRNWTGDASVHLEWTAPTTNTDGLPLTDLAEYRVYVSTHGPNDPEATLAKAVTPSGSGRQECEITGLTNGATYSLAVQAVDRVGNRSEFSNWVTAKPLHAIWVHPVHGAYTTIAEALAGAEKGSTVMVGPGTYLVDQLELGHKSGRYEPDGIVLRSEKGPAVTTIKKSNAGDPLSISVNDGCKIIGFTIWNFDSYPGAIYCEAADNVLISNNIFVADEVSLTPLAVHISGYSYLGEDVPPDSATRVYNNVFVGKMYGVTTYYAYQDIFVENNIFIGNDAAINLGPDRESAIRSLPKYHVSYNAFMLNLANYFNPAQISFDCSSNLDVPQETAASVFVSCDLTDPGAGDYHLASSSTCRDVGNPDRTFDGILWRDCDGSRADLGAYGGPYAYLDGNNDGVSDCEVPPARPGVSYVFTGSQGNPLTLAAYDPAGKALTYDIVEGPTHGTLAGTAPNLLYNSSGDSAVEDSITFRVSNGSATSAPAKVTIIIKTANASPTAQDALVQVHSITDQTASPTIFGLQASDVDGDRLSFTIDTQPGVGTLACESLPECWYWPPKDFLGVTSFTYHVSDGLAQTGSVTVWLGVHDTNAVPAATSLSLKVPPAAGLVNFRLQCDDADGDPSRVELLSLPALGSLYCDKLTSVHPTGTGPQCWYVPAVGLVGMASFTYQCSDARAASVPATVALVVNTDPTIDSYRPLEAVVSVPEDGSELFEVVGPDPDDAVPAVGYQWFLGDSLVGTQSSFMYNPAPGSAAGGQYQLKAVVSDGVGTVERSWTIRVLAAAAQDDGTQTVTEWTTSTSKSGHLGTGYHLHDAVAGATGTVSFTWNVPVTPGVYRVYARWPSASTFTTAATYYVTDAGVVVDDLKADQTLNGGQWNLLGTYLFNETARVVVKIAKDETGVADAVRLEATDTPADIIVDDLAGSPFGGWQTLTGGFGGQYRTAPSATGASDPEGEFESQAASTMTFTWTPPSVVAGTWDLYARWPVVTSGAGNAKYLFSFGRTDGIRSQVTVDQRVDGGRWVFLGSYSVSEGDAPSIEIGNNANGTVVADAVKLVHRSAATSFVVDNDADANFAKDYPEGPPDVFGWSTAAQWVRKAAVSGFVGTSYLQAAPATSPTGWAEWRLPVGEDGNYEVYTRWTAGTDRTTAARFEVRHLGQAEPDVVMMNQQVDGGVWKYLGRFRFDVQHATSIRVLQSASGLTVADAVMFLKTDEDLPIIVDNSDPGFSTTHLNSEPSWNIPGALIGGFWGSDYLQTKGVGSTATWHPHIATAGYYDVFARWTAAPSRTTAAQYYIRYDGGQRIVARDQTKNGGSWVSLGRYFEQPGEATVEVSTVSTDWTVADAVRFDYTVLPPPIVVDNNNANNGDAGVCANDGNWPVGAGFADSYDNSFQGADKNYLSRSAGLAGVVRWTPALPLRGYYAVYAWWPTPSSDVVANYATQAPFKVVHSGAPAGETRLMNQQTGGGKWNYLGTFLFDPGMGGYVELSAAAAGRVLADAVQFAPEGR